MVDLDVRARGLRARGPRAAAPFRAAALWVAARPLVAQVALLYGASRLVSTALFLVVSLHAAPASAFGERPDLMRQLLGWDSGWYQSIAFNGYPAVIPVQDGAVQPNAWAFLPAYPFTVRLLALGVPASGPLVAVVLSTVAGLGATVLLALLVRRHATAAHAMTAATVFCLGPTAYILQTGYAESFGLLLLFGFLLLVDRHRYVAAAALAVPLSFARPGMQAVALFIGLHLVVRVIDQRRRRARLPRAEVARVLVLGAVCTLLGLVWPAIAGLLSDRRDAYLATELSWSRNYTGSTAFAPFTPWVDAFRLWFGSSGLLLLAVLLLAAAALLLGRRARALGSTIGLFTASWFVYILAVFFPQASTFRLLMPAAPIAAVLAPATRTGLVVLAVGCVLLQAFWLFHGYGAVATAWSSP